MKLKFLYIPSFLFALLLSQSAYSQEIRLKGKEDSPFMPVTIINKSSSPIKFRLKSRNESRVSTFELDAGGDGAAYVCSGNCKTGNMDFAWPNGKWFHGFKSGDTWEYCGDNRQSCDGREWDKW